MKIEKLSESLYHIKANIPQTRFAFSFYLITEGGGVLIEPGPAGLVPSLLEGMKQVGLQGLAYIIPTHIHLDHGGGCGKLAGLFPKSRVVIHPRAQKHLLDPTRLIEGTRMAYGNDFESQYGPILPVSKTQLVIPEDGEILEPKGRALQIIYAPGHAPHQIAIFDKKTGGLFCGEALGIPLPGDEELVLPSVSIQDFNPDLYVETINKLRQLNPKVLYFSHQGGVRDSVPLIDRLLRNMEVLRVVVPEKLRKGEPVEVIVEHTLELLPGGDQKNPVVMAILQETIMGFAYYYKRKGWS
ncbi:MAG: MBL fold metallo-hydrolase [Thermodesulfobacteriota bacterium]